jgi:hypothetical protein
VPSSGVSFLNSGSLLHPILPRSQCWCVDEESKFVLRVRDGSYYRIELPFTNEEEKDKVEDFKTVLKTILHYERTPSPFKRGFNDTPEWPQTPVRRQSQQLQPAKRWRLNKFWEPEDAAERAKWSPATPERAMSPREAPERPPRTSNSEDDVRSDNLIEEDVVREDSGIQSRIRHFESNSQSEDYSTEEDTITEGSVPSEKGEEEVVPSLDRSELRNEEDEIFSTVGEVEPSKPIVLPFRPRPPPSRAITAPPPLTLQTSPPPSPLSRTPSRDTDSISIASSRDSFYSMVSMEESTTASAEHESFHSIIPGEDTIQEQFADLKAHAHKRQTSEMTIIPDTPTPIRTIHNELAPQLAEPSDPTTPTLVSDSDEDSDNPPWSDAVTPPDTIRLRHIPRRQSGTSQRHSLEPLPRPVNLFSSPSAPSRGKLLSAALVQKAYALLVGPPAHLVALMLEIAAKILKGIPVMYDPHGKKERIPCSWEDSEIDEDEWDQDDYGIPLNGLRRRSSVSRGSDGGHSSGVD